MSFWTNDFTLQSKYVPLEMKLANEWQKDDVHRFCLSEFSNIINFASRSDIRNISIEPNDYEWTTWNGYGFKTSMKIVHSLFLNGWIRVFHGKIKRQTQFNLMLTSFGALTVREYLQVRKQQQPKKMYFCMNPFVVAVIVQPFKSNDNMKLTCAGEKHVLPPRVNSLPFFCSFYLSQMEFVDFISCVIKQCSSHIGPFFFLLCFVLFCLLQLTIGASIHIHLMIFTAMLTCFQLLNKYTSFLRII